MNMSASVISTSFLETLSSGYFVSYLNKIRSIGNLLNPHLNSVRLTSKISVALVFRQNQLKPVTRLPSKRMRKLSTFICKVFCFSIFAYIMDFEGVLLGTCRAAGYLACCVLQK